MKNNEIRLSEQELYSLIKESVIETLNEGKWSDYLSAGALGLGLAGSAVGTMVQDPKYSDNVDMPSHEITVQPGDDEIEFETDIEPQYISSEEDFYDNDEYVGESRLSNAIDRIITEEISKVLS